ncbi:MAG TPA: TonB family protein [Vicinamibacterales bacterium]|nr:TonB family protein [Vicinamibacterales bacterium]
MSEAFAASDLVRAIGFALLDFVWQGAAIGVVTALLLVVLRRATAQWRYGVACFGLAMMAIAPVATTAAYLRETAGDARSTSTAASDVRGPGAIQTPGQEGMTAAGPDARPAFLSVQWLEPRLPFVVLIWTSGVAVLALHLLCGWFGLRRIRAQAIALGVERWPAVVRHTARRLGLTRLRLFVSSRVAVPAVIGFFRPAIVVPASALAGLTPAHLDAILLHELAHIRRGDYLVNVVQCVVEILLFYHPAVWWVSTQIRREREHCCDDVASSLCVDRLTYARALTSLEELRMRTPRLAVGADGGELLNRIRRLIAPQSVTGPRVSGGLAMGVVLTIALLALNAHVGGSSVAAPPSAVPVVQSPTTVRPVAPDEASQPVRPRPAEPRVIPAVRPAPARRVQTPMVAAPEQNPPPRDQAQGGIGNLSGVVRDQTGGVIPGAQVAVTSAAPSVSHTVRTNARGEFDVADLGSGAYELSVSLPGFRTARNVIQVRGGQTVTVIVRLDIGSVAEAVTVRSPSTDARAAAPTRQPAANPQTVSDYFDAAKILYEQGRIAEAAGTTTRALELLRAAQPEVPIEVTPEPVHAAAGTGPTAPVRVGGHVKEPRKLRHVPPIYPADAAAAGIEGVVVLEAVIAKDGFVKDLTVLKSVPMLDEAALGAVRLWQFSPTLLNGVPIEVAMTVTVHFTAR